MDKNIFDFKFELRIGNYLKFEPTARGTVKLSQAMLQAILDNSNEVKNWLPIELSNYSKLNYLGFYHCNRIRSNTFQLGDITILHTHANPNVWKVIVDKKHNAYHPELKYIHQLQNLIFELTGKHLT